MVKELSLAGITTIEAANRFIAETYLPDHNRRLATPPELVDSAFVALARPDQIDDILCLHSERTVGRDNTVCYGKRVLQIPAGPGRPHYVKAHTFGSTSTPTARWPSSMDPVASPATGPTARRSKPKPGRPRDPLRRDQPVACGEVDSRSAPDHFPTGPTTSTEAVN